MVPVQKIFELSLIFIEVAYIDQKKLEKFMLL